MDRESDQQSHGLDLSLVCVAEIAADLMVEAARKMKVLCREHDQWIRDQNARRLPDYSNVARLYLKFNVSQQNELLAYAYWGRYKTYPRKFASTKIMNSEHLKPDSKDGYTALHLARFAQTWELQKVLETERRLQSLRSYLRALVSVRSAAHKFEKAYGRPK